MDKVQKRILVIGAAILFLLCVITIIVAVSRPSADSSFTPPPFEENAVAGTPEGIDENLLYRALEISNGFKVSICGNPIVNDSGDADIYFTADKENTVFVRLLVLTEDGEQIGTTGILKPNEYVKSVRIEKEIQTDTPVILKILSYEPDTYYSMGSASAKVTLRATEN